MHGAMGAEPLTQSAPWPVVLFSHCNIGARYEELVVVERLASWGFVVAAPDHVDNTIYDELDGKPSALSSDFLVTRGADMKDVLDAMLAGTKGVPAKLKGHLDQDRIGMFGHSFGSITTGYVLQNDARVKVGVMMAAPPENPLLAGVTVAKLKKPGLFFLAEEDNAVGASGNALIQQNYADYPAPAWLISVKDAGHWSFSDMAGITAVFAPGCGEGKRQQDPTQTFTYLDNDTGKSIGSAYVTAFFAGQLRGDAAGTAYLGQAKPDGVVTITHRE